MTDNSHVDDPMDVEYAHQEIQPDDRMIAETVTPETAPPAHSAKKVMKLAIYGVGAVGFVGVCLGAVYITMRHHPAPMINRNAMIRMQAMPGPGALMPGGMNVGQPPNANHGMPYPAPGQAGPAPVAPLSMPPGMPIGMNPTGAAPNDKQAALNGLMQPDGASGMHMPGGAPAPGGMTIPGGTPNSVSPPGVASATMSAPVAAMPVAPVAPIAPVAGVVTTSATPDMPNAQGLEGLPTNMPGASAPAKAAPVAASIEQDAYLKKSLQHCERALHDKAHPVAHRAVHHARPRMAATRTQPHAVALDGVTNNRALIEVDNGASMIVEVGDLVPEVGRVTSIRPEGVQIGTQFVPNTAQ